MKRCFVMALLGAVGLLPGASSALELRVATVNNGHMITLQRMANVYERANPGVTLKWITLEEGQLRQQVTRDAATQAGRFDIVTIGAYEAPIWGERGWLKPLQPSTSYDVGDLLPPIRAALSVKDTLYALPFYGESSMTLVRTDLLKSAGVTLGPAPTWEQIKAAAHQLHAPDKGVYGICLRGKPGWGENMTLLTTMANTQGGQWFDMAWTPQLNTPPWRQALSMYVELLKQYGPPGAAANGYNENLALFSAGRCGIWVDATVAGGFVNRPGQSSVAGKVGFLQAPVGSTPKGSHWLWTWALAVPSTSQHADAAKRFIEWATSREYIAMVAKTQGWGAVPSGTRKSTYAQAAFLQANAHAAVEQEAIATANPRDATLPKSPYVGVQWAAIPEFQAIGTAVGQLVAEQLQNRDGNTDQTLLKAQQLAERKMTEAGYRKP